MRECLSVHGSILPSEHQKTLQFDVNRKAFVAFSDFREYTLTQVKGGCLSLNLSIAARLLQTTSFLLCCLLWDAFASVGGRGRLIPPSPTGGCKSVCKDICIYIQFAAALFRYLIILLRHPAGSPVSRHSQACILLFILPLTFSVLLCEKVQLVRLNSLYPGIIA